MVLGKQLLYVRFATREKKSFQKIWNHRMYDFSSDQKRKHPMAWFLANRLFKLIITVTEVQKKSYFADQFERRCVPLPWYIHTKWTNENYVKSHAQQHTQAQSAKWFSGC